MQPCIAHLHIPRLRCNTASAESQAAIRQVELQRSFELEAVHLLLTRVVSVWPASSVSV